jgi:hypothetical protein
MFMIKRDNVNMLICNIKLQILEHAPVEYVLEYPSSMLFLLEKGGGGGGGEGRERERAETET